MGKGDFLWLAKEGPRSDWMEPGQGVPLTRDGGGILFPIPELWLYNLLKTRKILAVRLDQQQKRVNEWKGA